MQISEGFCRACLHKYEEPTDLIPYNEKNRRLFVYSTGLQVKCNDTFTFQICRDCFLNMKDSCRFKKLCRTSDKKFKQYMFIKDTGDAADFGTFLKNSEDSLSLRLPLAVGNSTPAPHKNKDDDNDSTCTSIRNFMTDILDGEEMPDSEARIIKELIEEEADILDDSLDSHWLQEDMSIETDFRMDFSFTPFSTPKSVQYDHCYTPKKIDDEKEQKNHYYTSPDHNKIESVSQFDMPLLDDYDMELNKVPDIPMDEVNMEYCNNTNIQIEETVNGIVEESHYIISNEVNNVGNEDHINAELYFEETQFPENKATEIMVDNNVNVIEENLLDIDEKSNDFVGPTAEENNFSIIVTQGKVDTKPDDSPLNNELDYYISKAELKKKISKKTMEKGKQCTIDRNLEIALQNGSNTEFSLDQLLTSPRVSIRSGASTPTIRNILYGELPDEETSPNLCQQIEKLENVEPESKTLYEFLNNNSNIESPKSKINNFDTVKLDKLDSHKSTGIDESADDFKVINENSIDFEKLLSNNENEDKINTSEGKLTKVESIDDLVGLLETENKKVYEHQNEEFKRPFSPPYNKYDLQSCLCKMCNKTFVSKAILKWHLSKVHKIKVVAEVKKRDPMPKMCNVCGKTYIGTGNLIKHMKKHDVKEVNKEEHEDYECKECSVYFETQRALGLHMRIHKPKTLPDVKNSKEFVCADCGKVSLNLSNFLLHKRRHTKDYKISCTVCGRGFYRNSDLKLHMRNVHSDAKGIECHICGKEYKRRDSLRAHMKLHQGGFVYRCEFCNQGYLTKSVLERHLKSDKCASNRDKVTREQAAAARAPRVAQAVGSADTIQRMLDKKSETFHNANNISTEIEL